MLKVGDKIKIRNSKRLELIGLRKLCGKKAEIISVVTARNHINGVMAKVKGAGCANKKFIPIESVIAAEEVDQLRTLAILKSSGL